MDVKNSRDALLFRRTILAQLEAASPASLPVSTISIGAKLSGFDFENRELEANIDYLADKKYISLEHSAISAAHVRAKLSAAGRDYLESGIF